MPQIFHPSANTIAKASIFGAIFVAATVGYVISALDRSPWHTGVETVITQPVPFSHEHHVRGLGIDCRYCHTTVEKSGYAGIPAIKTCMTCHSVVWNNAPILQPIRESWRTGKAIQWNRVHILPDFVYFNHSVHVAKGVGCSTCHGRVDLMPLTWRAGSLQMEWCLNCHREPELFVRPKDQVFNMEYDPTNDKAHPGETQLSLGTKLVQEYHVHKDQLTNCSICHR